MEATILTKIAYGEINLDEIMKAKVDDVNKTILLAAYYTLQWGSCLAVWRGRWAFRKMKASFLPDRERNIQAAVLPASEILFPKSILWQYHVKGKKTYKDLTVEN